MRCIREVGKGVKWMPKSSAQLFWAKVNQIVLKKLSP